MTQSEKEHLLTATVADSESRCAREFQQWADAGNEFVGRPVYRLVAWNAWRAAWSLLRNDAERWAQS